MGIPIPRLSLRYAIVDGANDYIPDFYLLCNGKYYRKGQLEELKQLLCNDDSLEDIISQFHSTLTQQEQEKFRPEELQLVINNQPINDSECFSTVYHPEEDKIEISKKE
ncbi:hypothetical protein BX667DRAFT_509719 [Coemansia mojavensis]|nr:hypothetical protein BX667DRAFT_509719 [Coemansia mojavensis]